MATSTLTAPIQGFCTADIETDGRENPDVGNCAALIAAQACGATILLGIME